MDPSDLELFFKKPFKNGIFEVLPKKNFKTKKSISNHGGKGDLKSGGVQPPLESP